MVRTIVLGVVCTCWMGIAAAEPKPQDPYADPVAAKTPAKKQAKSIDPPVQPAEIDWDATLEEVGPFAIGGIVLLSIVLVVRTRRARRMRKILENRRTQFGLSAIDPTVLQQHRAAWENTPVITPAAIDPSPIAPSPITPILPVIAPPPPPRRARMAQGSQHPPLASDVLVGPPQMPAMVAAVAPRPAAMVMHPFATSGSQPLAKTLPPPPPPAHYPLTFAASTLLARTTRRGHAAVEPNLAAQRWDDVRTENDEAATDFVINFARGSQDDELETTRARMHALEATVAMKR